MTYLKFRKLTDDFSVSSQITTADIDEIVATGFVTVIGNRPDEELSHISNEHKPHHKDLAELFAERSIDYIYQPIRQLSYQDLEAFSEILCQAKVPILSYCASGTRSTILWALSQIIIDKKPSQPIAEIARNAGYDISSYLN